ncbi:MAG: AI-2E family transporter [Planctomycetota bacterium]
MNIKNIYIRIGFVSLVVFFIFYFIYILRAIVNPILIALIISYILHPLIKFLEKVFKSRSIAIIGMYVLFIFTTFVVVVFIVPPVLSDIYHFAGAFFIGDIYTAMDKGKPFIKNQTKLIVDYNNNNEYDPPIVTALLEKVSNFLERRIENFPALKSVIKTKLDIDNIKNYFFEKFRPYLGNEAQFVKSFFNIILIYLILVPIYVIFLSFYLEKIYDFFTFYLPPKYKNKITGFLKKVDVIISAYLRGKVWIGFIKSSITLGGLLIVGSAFPLAFAGLQFIATLVPNLFIVIGILPNFIINSIQSGTTSYTTLGSLAVLGFIELLEGIVLTPVILGKNVGLHPVIVFIALLAGAKLFGILGLLVAIPTVSIIKVVWTDFVGPALKEALSNPPFNE